MSRSIVLGHIVYNLSMLKIKCLRYNAKNNNYASIYNCCASSGEVSGCILRWQNDTPAGDTIGHHAFPVVHSGFYTG